MFDWLAQQSPRELIGLVAVAGGILFLVIAVVSAQWASVRKAEMRMHQAEQELALKQQMIERGMSADEIAKVLAAGQGSVGKSSRCRSKYADEPVKV
jgi:hypothetical protein